MSEWIENMSDSLTGKFFCFLKKWTGRQLNLRETKVNPRLQPFKQLENIAMLRQTKRCSRITLFMQKSGFHSVKDHLGACSLWTAMQRLVYANMQSRTDPQPHGKTHENFFNETHRGKKTTHLSQHTFIMVYDILILGPLFYFEVWTFVPQGQTLNTSNSSG